MKNDTANSSFKLRIHQKSYNGADLIGERYFCLLKMCFEDKIEPILC